jgi:hypothetical protein
LSSHGVPVLKDQQAATAVHVRGYGTGRVCSPQRNSDPNEHIVTNFTNSAYLATDCCSFDM